MKDVNRNQKKSSVLDDARGIGSLGGIHTHAAESLHVVPQVDFNREIGRF